MSSPADQYARFRRRQGSPALAAFEQTLAFALDDFQRQACEALEAGRGVLVAAPTGAGKTVVAEFGVQLALAAGRKCFYTTPIKALSNQKYKDLCDTIGPDQVGLLTGDTVLNAAAPVVVMTTEVLRNMLYEGSSALTGLAVVVMDEVHYLADRFRGPVWEEVIIHLPEHVQVISLSATVSNAEELGAWLDTVRGVTDVVVSEHRPVPLWQHVMTPDGLVDLFVEDAEGRRRLNPDLAGLARTSSGRAPRPSGRRGHRGRGGPGRWPTDAAPRGPHRDEGRRPASRAQVLRRLDAQGLLPAITFIFSRNGCDAAVAQCLAAGLRLTSTEERREIRDIARARCAQISQADLAALGYDTWLEGLGRGIAAHHAGLLPIFKEVVEDLFSRGLVRAVFATETLALGINMPARTVVLEKLVKFNGQAHVPVTAGEYTQLTGRAGRRGIDVEGHAVVVWRPEIDLDQVAGLASTRTYPLRSSFRPTSNMAVNLVDQVGRDVARTVLESSFAQFQADRGVVGLARRVRELDSAIEGYAEAMRCHLGDFAEYGRLREELSRAEKSRSKQASARRRQDRIASVRNLRTGDIVLIPGGRRQGYAVVLDGGNGLDGPVVLTLDRQVRRIRPEELSDALTRVGRLRVPARFNPRTADQRRDLASSLRNALATLEPSTPATEPDTTDEEATDALIAGLRRQLREHPCHACADREHHARWAQRLHQAERERAGLLRNIDGRTNTIASTFDRICDLLLELGYLAEDAQRPGGLAVTGRGRRLRRIYHEKDLLVAECLRAGTWDGLGPAGLAAMAGAIVYESRAEADPYPAIPSRLRGPLEETTTLWSDLTDRQVAHRLDPMPAPDLGFVDPLHAWARGVALDQVLTDSDLPAGDLVRWIRQAIDLLGQVAAACAGHPASDRAEADAALAQVARQASAVIDRAVVAQAVRAT